MSEEQKEEGANRVISLLVRSGIGIDPILANRIKNETDNIFKEGENYALCQRSADSKEISIDMKTIAREVYGE